MRTELPVEFTPLNLKAFLHTNFGVCGCAEIDTIIETVIKFLEWCDLDGKEPFYDELYSEKGIFYILAGVVDSIGLIEHGTSIRFPWLTSDGKRFLKALRECSIDELENAEGEAYNGVTYGDF